MQGYFIVIDGADGSGKKTQWEKLIARLVAEGYPVAAFDFPQYDKTFFGDMVRRYLKGEFGPAAQVSPYLASVLFAADRWQAKPEIESVLAAGKIIVSNRYIESNLAIQRAKLADLEERGRYLQWEEEMEYRVFGIPRAHLVIYLAVPAEVSFQLTEQRAQSGQGSRDGHEQLEFLKAMDASYRELAGRLGWLVIDCAPMGTMRSRTDIADEIWSKLQSKLPQK